MGAVKSLALLGLTRAGIPKATQWSRLSTQERFWRYVNKTESCWLWLSAVNSAGYGIFNSGGEFRSRLAHRYSFHINKGPLKPGVLVRHLCHNPACVNPAHLECGSDADNHKDAARVGAYGGGKDLDLLQIFLLARQGFCFSQISRLIKKPENSIRYILRGQRRPHLKIEFGLAMRAWEET